MVLESIEERGPFLRNSTPPSSSLMYKFLPDLVLSEVPSVMEDPCPRSDVDVIVFDS